MKKIIIIHLFLLLGLLTFGQKTNLETNKKNVLDFMQKAWGNKDENAVKKLIHPNYIQHNPQSGDKPESIIGMFQYISPKITNVRIIAEGDLVLAHNDSKGWGDETRWVSFDVFKIKDNQIIEHWDVMQKYAEQSASGHTMIDGETQISDLNKTAENKTLVKNFYDDVFYGGNYQNIEKYMDANYIQHNPMAKDGISGFQQVMKQMQEKGISIKMIKSYKFIAEGNFVFVHSKGEMGGKTQAFADLFRIQNGKIVEHWDCIQEAVSAEKSRNGHDMFDDVSK